MADDNDSKKAATIPGNDRKCPNCGGTLTYDPKSEKLFCSLCEKYKEITYEAHEDQKVEGIAYNDILNSNRATLGDKCRLLSCDGCGAELIYDSAQISGSCPFCGSTNIIPAASAGSIMRPTGIIPFSVAEERARASFQRYLEEELFFPKLKHYDLENLFPVYLPYFSFDTDTESDYQIEIGYRDSDNNIIYKPKSGSYERSFSDIKVFADSKAHNGQINRIREFRPSSIRPFHPDYMAGYYAERNSMTLKHGFEVARYEMSKVLDKAIPKHALREFKGDKYQNLRYKTEYSKTKYKYILAPFYLASVNYKGKKYDVAINGNTGKVACAMPSPRKFLKKLLITLGIIAAVALIAYLVCRSLF